jgi:homogentisate 1,2-dioxygenase/Fumarylacetoacetate (FAA) hydrolase family
MGSYISGFGNYFSTEVVPGALSIGRNLPQRVPFGLYVQQLSGSAFTAPRAENQRTWIYRLRPTANHPAFTPYEGAPHFKSAPFDAMPAGPKRLRWDPPLRFSRGHATSMYWTVAQIVTHRTSGGCNLRPGDILGTGTISAPDPCGYGSLLEISHGGTEPFGLPTSEMRTFLEDGDEVIMAATICAEGFVPIGFDNCIGRVKSSL